MAAKSPTAVAISASAMPGPTALRLVLPIALRSRNARMMPSTVPSNPINGVTDAVVASQLIFRSSLAISSLTPNCNARPDRLEAGAAHRAEIQKRANDAEHRSQQPDKWRDRCRSGQPAHIPFQLGHLFAHTQLQSALHSRTIGDAAAGLDLPLDFFVTEIKNRHQRRWTELLASQHDRIHPAGLAKGPQESRVGFSRSAQTSPLGKDDGPGKNRKEDQHSQHSRSRRRGVLNNTPYFGLKK